MPPEVAFEDETDRTAADYHVVSAGALPYLMRAASESRSSTGVAGSGSPLSVVRNVSQPPLSPSHPGRYHSNPINTLLPTESLVGHQKLSHFNEAFLLLHFRNTLGAWLDVCDHEMHFSVDVVERAPSCPLLLYACLAIAARHLSHTMNSVPPNSPDEYHERCIAILLPVLENRDFKIGIEILLASTVILRFFEQVSSPTPSNDLQRHLLAGSVYVSSQVDCAISGGLAEASFWVFVMQDIQFALTYQNPLRLTLSPFEEKLRPVWEQKGSQTDRDWTHRAIWLLAETINYCYGTSDQLNIDAVDGGTLKSKIYKWEMEKPAHFRPLHFSQADPRSRRPFPVVWYSNSSHATAVQHICMAKTLLLEHELQNMPLAPHSEDGIRRMKDDIMKNLGILFGIALSKGDNPSVRIMACHALCACGSWIRDPLSQNILLDLLRKTETNNGWPWAFEVQKLSEDWGLTTG